MNCCVTYHATFIEKVRFHALCKFDVLLIRLHSLFCTNSFKVVIAFDFNVSFIYYFNFNRRIKFGEKFDLFSCNLFEAAVQYANCIHCELKIIAGKSLLFYPNSFPNITTFDFRIGCIQQFRFLR